MKVYKKKKGFRFKRLTAYASCHTQMMKMLPPSQTAVFIIYLQPVTNYLCVPIGLSVPIDDHCMFHTHIHTYIVTHIHA